MMADDNNPLAPGRDFAERLLLLKAVTQDRMGSPWGNCLEACYATLLGVPLEDVPDPRNECRNDVEACALESLDERIPWLADWLSESWGLAAIHGEGKHPPGVLLRKEDVPLFWIAHGKSNRGLGHAVVYSNGKLLWDPHPSRDGLLAVEGWTVFAPVGPIWDRLLRGYVVPMEAITSMGGTRPRKAAKPKTPS